jgi:flagellar biosynthetic protein FliQ
LALVPFVIASEAKQSGISLQWQSGLLRYARNDGEGAFAPRRVAGMKVEQGILQMTGPETLDVARDAIWTIVIVSSPLMVVGLVVGVVVSLFQALTQIQEQTLIYVPKILAIFATMLLALPFMADALHAHMLRISSRIIGG